MGRAIYLLDDLDGWGLRSQRFGSSFKEKKKKFPVWDIFSDLDLFLEIPFKASEGAMNSAAYVPLGTLHSTFKMESLRKAAGDTQQGQLKPLHAALPVMGGHSLGVTTMTTAWHRAGTHHSCKLLLPEPLGHHISMDQLDEETEAKWVRTVIRDHKIGAAGV